MMGALSHLRRELPRVLGLPQLISARLTQARSLSQEAGKNAEQAKAPETTSQLVEQQPIDDDFDIRLIHKEKTTYVEAIPVDITKGANIIKKDSNACVLCRLNLHNLQYTDVMITSQFIKRNGEIATFRESKLCLTQYKNIIRLIKQAQRCNLIKRPENYLVPGPWHDLNTYLERDRKRDQPMKVIKKQYWKI